MKKYRVAYEIQYRGLTIVGEEQNVEASCESDAESDVTEMIMNNIMIFQTAVECDDDE